MTFTVDGAQWTYEADTNGKKCKFINFAQYQALTKTISNLMRLREHSYNFPIAHDSQRGWVVVRLEENERLHSILHTAKPDVC